MKRKSNPDDAALWILANWDQIVQAISLAVKLQREVYDQALKRGFTEAQALHLAANFSLQSFALGVNKP